MKRHLILFAACIWALGGLHAQVFSDHFDNDDPANTGGAGVYTHSESNSEWTITASMMSAPFDPFTYMPHDPGTGMTNLVDASGNNKVYVRAKASAIGTQLRLDLQDNSQMATTMAGLTQTLTTSFQVLEFDFSGGYTDGGFGGTGCSSGPCAVDSSMIQNLLFTPNPGAGFVGTIVIDFVSFGSPPDTVITSDVYQDHFDVDSSAFNFTELGAGYSVSQSGTEVVITGDGTTPMWDPLAYSFINRATSDTFDIDITGNFKMYIKAKSTVANTALRVDVLDIDGFASTAGSITKLVGTDYSIFEFNYTGVMDDLGYGGTPCTSGTAPCPVDGSRISTLVFFIAPGVGGFVGDVTIDYISFGVSLEAPGPAPELVYGDHFGNETLEYTTTTSTFNLSETSSELLIEGDGTSAAFSSVSYVLHDKTDGSDIFVNMAPGADKVFVRAKVDSGSVPLRIDLTDTANYHTSDPSLTRVVTDEYTTLEFDFAGQYLDAAYGGTACGTPSCPVDFQSITQMILFPDPIQGGFDGTLHIDFISIGQPLGDDLGPTGVIDYADEMDDNTALFVSDPTGFTSQFSGGEWLITGDGTAGKYAPMVYTGHNDLGEMALIDVMGSSNILFVRAKASVANTALRIDVQDNQDYVSNLSAVSANLSTDYQVYEFDFTNSYQDGGYGGTPCTNTTAPCPVDPERIENLQVFIDADSGEYAGTVTIDWFSFGSSLVSSIQTLDYVQAIRLYPNPTSSLLHVDYQLEKSAQVELKVSNLMGQQVGLSSAQQQIPGPNAQVLDLSPLPQGLYFIQVWIDGKLAATSPITKK
ncbi:MAG: T9SS type A sorting domain-containing protein [Bacteroidota bacterium]